MDSTQIFPSIPSGSFVVVKMWESEREKEREREREREKGRRIKGGKRFIWRLFHLSLRKAETLPPLLLLLLLFVH